MSETNPDFQALKVGFIHLIAIPLFPYVPTCQNYNLNKARPPKLLFSIL
jgi:hypothetical protein